MNLPGLKLYGFAEPQTIDCMPFDRERTAPNYHRSIMPKKRRPVLGEDYIICEDGRAQFTAEFLARRG
jgi:hypothetical protein